MAADLTGSGRRLVPVMDIGGTHVSGALFDPSTSTLLDESRCRRELDCSAEQEHILEQVVACATGIDAPSTAVWGVAVPGPFDYEAGIARYHDVGKFDALNGVDVGRALCERIPAEPVAVRFLNDASAFGLGESTAGGAATGAGRMVGLTLGTGIGSVFLENGAVVEDRPDVPPEGRVDLLRIDGHPLEDTVSRRAIMARYAELHDGTKPDVAAIAQRADGGDATARQVLRAAFHALGSALRPWIESFAPEFVVMGGSITASWNLIAEPVQQELDPVRVMRSRLGEDAALVGAGSFVAETSDDR